MIAGTHLEKVWDVLGEDICGIHQHFCVAKKKFYRIVRHAQTVIGREREREREGVCGGREMGGERITRGCKERVGSEFNYSRTLLQRHL